VVGSNTDHAKIGFQVSETFSAAVYHAVVGGCFSARQMDLLEQLRGCRMSCTNSNVNMRRWKAG